MKAMIPRWRYQMPPGAARNVFGKVISVAPNAGDAREMLWRSRVHISTLPACRCLSRAAIQSFPQRMEWFWADSHRLVLCYLGTVVIIFEPIPLSRATGRKTTFCVPRNGEGTEGGKA